MERDKVKINGSKIILSLFKKYKNEPWVLSSSEILKKKQSWFPGKWGAEGFVSFPKVRPFEIRGQIKKSLILNSHEKIKIHRNPNYFHSSRA